MTFYTSVHRYGNKMLYRGYDKKGNRIHKKFSYSPTLFFPTNNEDTDWSALDGTPVKPKKFSTMREAKEAIEKYDDVDNFQVHGNTNYVAQFIQAVYPGEIDFDTKFIRIGDFDIEVESDDGFPFPEYAEHPVISIAYKSNQNNIYYVWGLGGDFDPENCNIDLGGALIRYVKCDSEAELLQKFVVFWENNCPDIITGWNIRLFDIPYIINRIVKICGQETANALSPWKKLNYRKATIKGKSLDVYEIFGVAQMDYYDIFQKFGYTYGNQESYTLDHIAHVVLGENKLSYEEHGSLHSLYRNDYQKFIEYNIKDVMLVDKIDKETNLMDLAIRLAYKGGVNFPDVFGTTAIWDSITFRYLHDRKIAVPKSKGKMKADYPGGYVKEPFVGRNEYVVSFDLNSLYPNLIVQYNMSPETICDNIRGNSGVDHYLNGGSTNVGDEYAVAANGICFSKEKRGFLPELIIGLYDERKATKKRMIEKKREYEKNETHELEREITQLDNNQMAVKILLNSLYGAMGNQYFRYFDLRIAEAITLSGQLSIRWAEKSVNGYMNKILKKSDEDYVIAIDTDSLYVNMAPLVQAAKPKSPIDFLNKCCEEKFEKVISKAYDNLFEQMTAYDNRMVMEREVIADVGVWTGKKRYILNVFDNEGVRYTEPKLKIMGLEAVKSSTPQVVRDKFTEAYKIILEGKEKDIQKFVKDFETKFKALPPEEVSFPRGVSDIDKWVNDGRYCKSGTPIHVRGSINFNNEIRKIGLDSTVEEIKNGSKVKFCYLKKPNPIQDHVISFPQYLPRELNIHSYIDYDTQYEKTFKEPLKLVTDSIGWNLEKINTLDAFL